MHFKKLTSLHGPLTQITLTDFEKTILTSLVKKASIGSLYDDIKLSDNNPNYDKVVIATVLRTFLRKAS